MSVEEIENDNDGQLEKYIDEQSKIIVTDNGEDKGIIISIGEYERIQREIRELSRALKC